MSPQDKKAFEDKWECELTLEGASFGADGNENEFNYHCCPKGLAEFKSYLGFWLRDNYFPIYHTMVMESISITTTEKLSDVDISDFEKEFEVKCRGYSISCNSNRIEYKFA